MLFIYFHKRSINIPLTTGTNREWAIRFENYWMNNDYTKYLVKELDNTIVLGDQAIKSPVLGIKSTDWLSATCRNVIMMSQGVDMVFASGFFADEANKYIEEISSKQDVHLYMNHMFKFTDTQKATLVDCDSIVVTGNTKIRDYWLQEYDYSERAWDIGWADGQLERLGLPKKFI